MLIKRKFVIVILALIAILILIAWFLFQNSQIQELPLIELTENPQEKIENLLESASEYEEMGYLTKPANDSAASIYERVLTIDPVNEEAIGGLHRIGEHYLGLAEKAMEKGKLTEAEETLTEANSVDPANPKIRQMRARLDEKLRTQVQPAPPDTSEGEKKAREGNEVDRIIDKMKSGSIAFNVPTNINIADFPQVQLILDLTESVEKLKQLITEQGEKVGATIKVSRRMQAQLTGSMFQITALTPEIQAISGKEKTEWKWEIHPKKEGEHKLHLTLNALFEIDGQSNTRNFKTFDKVILVNVTTGQKLSSFVSNNWQWLWAAILVPFAGWVLKRKK
ncbi:MAG: tetratricopeptide repeat protein [Gammaproteobacteria bacterium]|nr:tetratricopeptide repeat protein [Gammaproteobacteria bacterium]